MADRGLPALTVAAVQAAPQFLDVEGTLDKLDHLVGEAAGNGAELVAFGESFVAGFPVWGGVLPPIEQHGLHERLVASSITVPGSEVARLGQIATRHSVLLSVGVNERAPHSLGQLFNSNLIFDREGRLVNHRRKLVATYYERLTWSHGDAHDLRPVELDGWNVGALICGENTNTLARYTLLAQGERVHVASYPPSWPFDQREGQADYDLQDAIRIRSAAHAFEGKVFSVVAATALGDDAVAAVAEGDSRVEQLLRSAPTASLIVGPRGEVLAGPLVGGEGILYADVDLQDEVVLKRIHDIVGTYQRTDLFQLRVDTSRPAAVTLVDDTPARPEPQGEENEPND
ncbi:nitrilase/aliphatic nitrilase [Spinactinospora alkalitolerans]|uniref:Nitrilase/aliphatic nitrilase n=1 Tax=Spinactinospora alkalitolerans TaxID=687207 RepID=A0A852TW86_9ACTN|nr:carbon-nitrogen hydrolase family protein [Spinactinospora alkalitolerans]NYE47991.1 nitrilase/aliphatic nitrilase [Spinactinospora alkalitolerans]